jgi:hypothetical protein
LKTAALRLLPALLVVSFLLLPASAQARVTHIIAVDSRGVLYEYDRSELQADYLLQQAGQPALLFADFTARRPVAFKDDRLGYVDYQALLEEYARSAIAGASFVPDQYAAGSAAVIFPMPPGIISRVFEDGQVIGREKILLPMHSSDAGPGRLLAAGFSVIADKTEAQPVLANIRYTVLGDTGENYRYAWYGYKDGQLFSSQYYTTENHFDFVPTQPGAYHMKAWIVEPTGAYRVALSAETEVFSPVAIVTPDFPWQYRLGYITEPVAKLIQHHMEHPSWDVYQVHGFHLTRTYMQPDGTTGYWAGIGYSYWIGFDGTIYEGRGRMLGGHAGADWNNRTLGIGYQGDFNSQNMTDEQVASGAWLNAVLLVESGLTPDDIIGHSAVSDTTCPGANFRMGELKQAVRSLLPPEYLRAKP